MSNTQDGTAGFEGTLDESYDWNENPQLIGWGEYRFTIEIAGAEYIIFLSTLDGNWLDPGRGDDNKIVFYVNFDQASSQDPIEFEVKVYNYHSQTWDVVAENERVTVWDLSGIPREREKLNYCIFEGDCAFTMTNHLNWGVVEVPFYNEHHTFDVDVHVVSPLQISQGKSVRITDYVEQSSLGTSYKPTIWRFDSGAGLYVKGGELDTYSHFSTTHLTSPSRVGVELLPYRLYQKDPRSSWWGVTIEAVAGGTATIQDTRISHAHVGVDSWRSTTIARSYIDSCDRGISSQRNRMILTRDTIRYCREGIRANDYVGPVEAGPMLLIDSTQVIWSTQNGISLLLQRLVTASRKQGIQIRQSEIKYNGGHGVWAAYAEPNVRDCNISHNGWLKGTVLDSIPDSYTGNAGVFLSTNAAMIYLNGSDFQSNVGPGVWSIHGTIEGLGELTSYDTYDSRGWNCFHNNFVSVRAAADAKILLGKRVENSAYYINDRNSFRYPRWKDPQSQRYINFHIIGAGLIEAEHNFWLPSTDTWLLVSHANPVYSGYPIFTHDSVRCAESVSPGGPTIEIPGSDGASTLLRLMSEDSLSAAWNHIKATISDGFGESDASIYTWALQRIRLISDIDSAQVLLEQKAFNGSNNALTLHSLMNLQSIYVILGDSTAAWHLCDTLYAKLPSDFIPDDSLAIDLYRTDLMWLINKDTTSATNLITGLWADHPEDIRVRTMYVCITQDTTAYWHGFEDGMEKSPLPERLIRPNEIEILGSHPNPFNPTTTIRYYCSTSASIALRVYSTDGRLVDSRDLGLRESGVHYLQYSADHLPSGVYMAVLDNGERSASIKVVLEK